MDERLLCDMGAIAPDGSQLRKVIHNSTSQNSLTPKTGGVCSLREKTWTFYHAAPLSIAGATVYSAEQRHLGVRDEIFSVKIRPGDATPITRLF